MFPLVIFVAIISSSLVFLKWNTVKRANKRDVKFYSDKREDQIFKSNYLYKTIFIGSYGSNNLKEIERIKRKKFNNLLKSRYSVRIKKKPFWINSGIFYFFTIDAMEINYKSSSSLQKIIKRQEKLSLR